MFLTTAPFTLRDIVGPASPVEAGIVASLAQPGGNVTGTTNRLGDLGGKVLQLITDCAEAFPNRRSGRLCKPWIHQYAAGHRPESPTARSGARSDRLRTPEDLEWRPCESRLHGSWELRHTIWKTVRRHLGGLTAKPLCTSETARTQCRRARTAPSRRTTPAVSCGPGARTQAQRESAQGGSMAENEHPKGALLFILVFLVLVVLFWINTYMRLWLRY